MDPKRLGSLFASRLSFARTFLRKMTREGWKIELSLQDLDSRGFGHCVYELHGLKGLYSLVIYSNELQDDERTDRVVARKWDVACALCLGKVTASRIAELEPHVTQQEYGRFDHSVLVLSRANKSVSAFQRAVDQLQSSNGDWHWLLDRGYLLRTSAVYGNNKFGIAPFEHLAETDLATPFLGQMAVVYLLREFSMHLVEHIASHAAKAPCHLPLGVKSGLGVGNATGLGMVTFIYRHPGLIHQWIHARESIRQEIGCLVPTLSEWRKLASLMEGAMVHLEQATVKDLEQSLQTETIMRELSRIRELLSDQADAIGEWQGLLRQIEESFSVATEELVVNLLMEIYPDLSDPMEHHMGAQESFELDPLMTLGELRQKIEDSYQWVLGSPGLVPGSRTRYWYSSVDKMEPSFCHHSLENPVLGEPLAFDGPEKIMALYGIMKIWPEESLVKDLIEANPQFKAIICRVQNVGHLAYGELRGNLMGDDTSPLDWLRLKLAFLGAQKFDPQSERWIRVTFFQGAPLANRWEPESPWWSLSQQV